MTKKGKSASFRFDKGHNYMKTLIVIMMMMTQPITIMVQQLLKNPGTQVIKILTTQEHIL